MAIERGTTLQRRAEAESLSATLPPLMVAAERVASTVAQGVHGRRRVGQGDTFWQFRRYQPGDTVSAIDWRQSAKGRHIYIRQTEWEAAESVWLWCDPSPSMQYGSTLAPTTKSERAVVLTLALAALLVRGGERIALLDGRSMPSTGRAAFNRLADRLLARMEGKDAGKTETEGSLPPVHNLPRHAQVVLVGDFLSPIDDIERTVRGYMTEGLRGHLLQVMDPAEAELPFHGRTRFEGFEGEEDFTIGRVEALREQYHRRIEARHAALVTVARTTGWTFATHRTDRPAEGALLALYTALARTLGSDRARF